MPASVRWYLLSLSLSAAAIATSILGDRQAKREITDKTWDVAAASLSVAESGSSDSTIRGE